MNMDNFTFTVTITAYFLFQVLLSKLPPNQNYALETVSRVGLNYG
jgi:hypothetical protein